ncbi:single-stranded DNA-binding protein WHY3, chloroplastic-like isoform X2 [Raphanus sativus]|uniref:Single-stranded DNA-binding protein WHY3, chloroplastic-like isoform X2 n=1 Tax=Raphanus sativus TaxID=3726 RepID=A0A9W3CLV8_RAPSA|nr:single-stranded DNA-binding protein WHY3, chloroplastic-like isoform X2 [Raphanus sativus]
MLKRPVCSCSWCSSVRLEQEIVTEIGNLVSLGPRESCEVFHDPDKGKGSDEGKVRKVLKVEPLPDGSGRFFNLSVQNKLLNVDEGVQTKVVCCSYLCFQLHLAAPYRLACIWVHVLLKTLSCI